MRCGGDAADSLEVECDNNYGLLRRDKDQETLEKMRGMRKEDAVLNMLINRSCTHAGVAKRLEDMEKYFANELPKLASFIGEKFGFKVADWIDCKTQIALASQSVVADSGGFISVGVVLAELGRSMSSASKNNDRPRELTNQLVRPKRKKHK